MTQHQPPERALSKSAQRRANDEAERAARLHFAQALDLLNPTPPTSARARRAERRRKARG